MVLLCPFFITKIMNEYKTLEECYKILSEILDNSKFTLDKCFYDFEIKYLQTILHVSGISLDVSSLRNLN